MPSDATYAYPADVIHFEPVTDRHLPMLRDWLARPHVSEWWDDPDTEIDYIRDMLAGRDTTKPFLFSLDGDTCGYIQYWYVRDARTPQWIAKEPWLARVPEDAVGIDLTVADESRLSQGIGSSVLRTFARRLWNKGYETIIIDPDPANARAVRAYEKAGFVASFEHEGPEGRTLIMEFDKERAGLPA